MKPEEKSQLSLWKVNFLSSILHLLPKIYPNLPVEPEPEPDPKHGSTKFLKTDPIQIRIHDTGSTVVFLESDKKKLRIVFKCPHNTFRKETF